MCHVACCIEAGASGSGMRGQVARNRTESSASKGTALRHACHDERTRGRRRDYVRLSADFAADQTEAKPLSSDSRARTVSMTHCRVQHTTVPNAEWTLGPRGA